MTPIEVARELELLRPFLKDLLIQDNARERVMKGRSIHEQDSPHLTIDRLIISVLNCVFQPIVDGISA
jgi:hypothetical protein